MNREDLIRELDRLARAATVGPSRWSRQAKHDEESERLRLMTNPSDDRIRALERAAKAGDAEAVQRLAHERRRTGTKRPRKQTVMRSCCDRFKNEEHHPDCKYRRNGDEELRRRQRRAKTTSDQEDLLQAAIAAERADGQAARVQRLVHYAVWRVGEVMRPRDPAAWEREGGEVTPKVIASLILSATRLDSASPGRGSALNTSAVIEDFRQRRMCVEEHHDEPCVYDDCDACQDCVPPEEGGGAPVYRQKVAAAFAFARPDEVAIGIMATVTNDGGLVSAPRSWTQSTTNPFRVAFGDDFRHWPLWDQVARRAVSLKGYEEELTDVDDVRVWDNFGRTADRFTILMQGETDGEPFYFSILSNASPSHPGRGIWMRESEPHDPVDAEGAQLEPWQELLPTDVLNAIWEERGRSIVRVPRELAERWAVLARGNYWS